MAGEERLGASFSIDITALKTGLQQANRLIKESNSQFKAAAAGLDDWTSSEEGLTAKLKNLNEVADIQAKKVDALQDEYDRCIADGLDPMSASAIKMRTDINEATAALQKTKAETAKYEKALDELGDAADDAGDAVEQTGEDAKDAGDGFTIAKGAIADFIGNGLTALVGAAKDAISSLYNLSAETREFRQDMATLNTAFDEAGFSAETATETWKDLYAIFGEDDRAVEAANNISRMAKTQEDLNDWVTITTGIWGTYQDALPVEGLAEAAGETAKVGKVTGVMADALNWSSEAAQMFSKYMSEDVTNAEDAFNVALGECNTEAERQALITDTLTALYGDAAKQYEDTAGSVMEANRAQAEQTLTMAELGEKIEPVTTAVSTGISKILDKILELTGDTDVEGFADRISKAFDGFINDVMPKIESGLQWIIDNKDILIAGITGIGAAFAAFKVVTLIQSVVSAMQGMTIAQAALNLVMSLNPIGLVVAAIAGLVAAFVVLWKKCEGFRNFWLGLWDTIKKAASSAWEGIKSVFSTVATFFESTFKNAWEKVKAVFSSGGKVFSGIKDGIITAFKAVVNALIKGINIVVKKPFEGLNTMLNTLYGLTIAGFKPFTWLTWRAPVPQIPYLATGGVVKKATTAVIGEDGAEAIVPLEKNTEWIDKVADKLASKQQAVVVNQTNNYAQAHTRYEIYKSKQQTAAAVRLALQGG